MELEVGMYVRTNIGIAKVHSIKDNKVLLIKTRNNRVGHYFTVLKEPSHNIIDLIEVGDYVNGKLVAKNKEVITTDNIYIGRYLYEKDNSLIGGEEDIKSIVTKEQFEVIKYEVK